MSHRYSYVESPDRNTFTFIINETFASHTVYRTNTDRYDELREGVINDTIEPAEAILIAAARETFAKQIRETNNDYHGVSVVNGHLHFNGQLVRNALAERILELVSEGLSIEPWIRFAEKVYRNPRPWVADELDLWLATSNLPLTEDGDFLAYKKIRDDYFDIYTGTFDNSPGRVCWVPEEEVDTDRNRTCSTGLHFCSQSYLPRFGDSSGNRVVVLKINPEHVVSIPSDYDNAKGRCWRYEVVAEIPVDQVADKVWEKVAVDYGTPEPATIVEKKVKRPRDVIIPGIGTWPGDSEATHLDVEDRDEDLIYVEYFDGRYETVVPGTSADFDHLACWFDEIIEMAEPGSDDYRIWYKVIYNAKDRREAMMLAYYFNQFEEDKAILSSNRHDVWIDHGGRVMNIANSVKRHINQNIPGVTADMVFNDEFSVCELVLSRTGHTNQSLRWREAVALADHVGRLRLNDLTQIVTHEWGTTTVIIPSLAGEVNGVGVALLHPSDNYNFQTGGELATIAAYRNMI